MCFGSRLCSTELKKRHSLEKSSFSREKLYVQAIAARRKKEVEQGRQYHCFDLGDKKRLLKIVHKVLPANQENHYLYGRTTQQCLQLAAAEQMARTAITMNHQEPKIQERPTCGKTATRCCILTIGGI